VQEGGEEKKAREKRGLYTFLSLFPDARIGAIESRETPDFIVRNASGILGIELTEYFRDAKLKHGSPGFAALKRKQRILHKAERFYRYELSGAPALVDVSWRNTPLYLVDERTLPSAMARLVAAASLRQGERHWSCGDLPSQISEHVRAIRAISTPDIWEWPLRESAWMPPDRSGLQATLKRKDDVASACRLKAPTVWLLVVAYGQTLSAQVSHFDKVATHEYESLFDRVYLVDIFTERCARLRLRAAVVHPLPRRKG